MALVYLEVWYSWRGGFINAAINELHAEAFSHHLFDDDWVLARKWSTSPSKKVALLAVNGYTSAGLIALK